MITASERFHKALLAPQKQMFIKFEFYDRNGTYINEFSKRITSSDVGTLSIDRSRPVRRSFNFSLENKKGDFTWGENNLIWLDKTIKLFVGLMTPRGVEYIPLGVFYLAEPQDQHTFDGIKTTITAFDKMSRFTDKRGRFMYETTIEKNVLITDAIKRIAESEGERNFNFDYITKRVPYELVYHAGENKYQALEELAGLAQADIYYDEFGVLRLKAIDLNEFSQLPVTWRYKIGDRFYAGNVRRLEDVEMANSVIALGGMSDVAVAKYQIRVTESDPLWRGSPYSIERIGEMLYMHNDGNPDNLIETNEEAKWRCKYELMNRLGYSERVSISISPNFVHDINDVIEVEDAANNVFGRYIIDSLQIPLQPQLMTIEARKERRVIDNWDFIS